MHRPEFQAHEPAATVSNAFLLKQDRPPGDQPDRYPHRGRQRYEHRQSHAYQEHIQRSLPAWQSKTVVVIRVKHSIDPACPRLSNAPPLFVQTHSKRTSTPQRVERSPFGSLARSRAQPLQTGRRRQERRLISLCMFVQHHCVGSHFYRCGPAQDLKQDLHPFLGRQVFNICALVPAVAPVTTLTSFPGANLLQFARASASCAHQTRQFAWPACALLCLVFVIRGPVGRQGQLLLYWILISK